MKFRAVIFKITTRTVQAFQGDSFILNSPNVVF